MSASLTGVAHPKPCEERISRVALKASLLHLTRGWGLCRAGVAAAGTPGVLDHPPGTILLIPCLLELLTVVGIDAAHAVDVNHALVLDGELWVVRDADPSVVFIGQDIHDDILNAGRVDRAETNRKREGCALVAELQRLEEGGLLRNIIEVDLGSKEEAS